MFVVADVAMKVATPPAGEAPGASCHGSVSTPRYYELFPLYAVRSASKRRSGAAPL